MKNFFNSLVTANSGISSKRFISLIGLIVFVMVVIVSFFGISTPDVLVYSLVGLILGNQGLSTIQKKSDSTEPPSNLK
jgi:Kef-type K+ transport system membrane component KefB